MELASILVITGCIIILGILFNKAYKRKTYFCDFSSKRIPHYTLNYILKHKWRILGGTQIKIVGTLMDLVIPYILAYLIDSVVPLKDIKLVIIYGLIMLGCAVVGFLGNMFANQLASKVAMMVTRDLRHDLFTHILSLSSKEVDEVTISSLTSRMTSDTYNIHHMTGMIQRIGTRAPILLIGGITITFILDKYMTLVLLLILPILVFVIFLISKLSLPIFSNVQLSLDKMVLTLRESITGIRVIKALSKEEYEKNRFDKVNKELINYELKSGITISYLNPITTTLLNFGLVFVIVVGAFLVNKGEILPGLILAFTTYFTIILNAMLSITRVFMILTKSIASARRIDYCFMLQSSLKHEKVNENKETNSFIEFRNVSFSYNKNNVVNDISFSINKGESLGIIGSTGSGKTTLINLLLHIYDVKSGEILIDGVNILSIDDEKFKKLFGVVFQNDTIFKGTLNENIDFGRGYSEDDIMEACKIALLDDFVKSDSLGLNKEIAAKGTNLSGGQKLRVLIARAVLSKPEILILDDAASALDYKTDMSIRQNIFKYLPHTTIIIVAQRASSVSKCDKILVIDGDVIKGEGTHESLLKNVELYKKIYQIQMGDADNE